MKKRTLNHYQYYKKKKIDNTPMIHRRYKILILLVMICYVVLTVRLYKVQILQNKHYMDVVIELSNNIVEGSTAPRGRIYDRNGVLLVDNVPVKMITYKKAKGVTTSREIEMAYKIAELISVDYADLKEETLKDFWILNHAKLANNKITEKEWQLLKERKLTNEDIAKRKLERVTKEELEQYKEIDLEAAYIYYLMNKGYSFAEKVIKKEKVTDEEYAIIAANKDDLEGFNTVLDWERYYPNGNTFRSILGNVSSSESGVPKELKDSY